MKVSELLVESKTRTTDFMSVMSDFLPLAMKELGIDVLPTIKIVPYVHDEVQPTFGQFDSENNIIRLGIEDRHPLDIIRTLAHELVHFRQNIRNELNDKSGETGSPQENEAHELAGIIMRNFNKQYSKYFKDRAISLKD